MASKAANFRSTCACERGAPECSSQHFPVGAPHVGQGTEDICFSVSSLFFIPRECAYRQSRIYPILDIAWPQSHKCQHRNVFLPPYGNRFRLHRSGGFNSRSNSAVWYVTILSLLKALVMQDNTQQGIVDVNSVVFDEA